MKELTVVRRGLLVVFVAVRLMRTARAFSSSSSSVPSRSTGALHRNAMHLAAVRERLFPEDLNILCDSKCSVCEWEINFLRRSDAKVNETPRLKFTDIEDPTYDEKDPSNGGITYAAGMEVMHGVLPSGKVVEGVPVFRAAYERVGLGWLFVIATWPVFKQLADAGYGIFARYRTRFTRGGKSVPDLVALYEERRKQQPVCEKDGAASAAKKAL